MFSYLLKNQRLKFTFSTKPLFQDLLSLVNDKRSFIDNRYLFLATCFVYNYTHYHAISITVFFRKNTVLSKFLQALWTI